MVPFHKIKNLERKERIVRDCNKIISVMLSDEMTIRQASECIHISKSRIHDYIHTYIKMYYPIKYAQLLKLLNYNRKYRAKPRKYWNY